MAQVAQVTRVEQVAQAARGVHLIPTTCIRGLASESALFAMPLRG